MWKARFFVSSDVINIENAKTSNKISIFTAVITSKSTFMKKILILLALLFAFGMRAQDAPYSKNSIIAGLKNNLKKSVNNLNELEQLNFLFTDYSIESIKPLDIRKNTTLNGRPLVIIFENEIDVQSTIQRLLATNVFDFVEPDFISHGSGTAAHNNGNVRPSMTPFAITPNDQFFFRQWGLHNDATFSLSPAIADADVDMTEAWGITTGSSTIKMAVIDSGIRMTHPEFSGRILLNTAEVLNNLDDDNNGYIDDNQGWDFVNNDNNPTDDHGHGTNVSGIAMANGNNSIGFAGVDWNCKLLPIKVLNNNNSGLNSNIIASFYYAINREVDLISISIGGTGFSTAYQNAVNLAHTLNIPVVACMMNFNNSVPYYPAAFPTVIAVGSTDPNDNRTNPFFWSFTSGSNFGPHIDVIAPGNYSYGLSHTSNTNYNTYWGGTSQATPLVAGIVSLMLAINPSLTPDQIKTILKNTAQDQVGNPIEDVLGFDNYYGAGRVNANNALLAAQATLSTATVVLDNEIAVYPNPTNGILFLKSAISTESFYVSVFDVSGRAIRNNIRVKDQIDVSLLKSGIYILQINAGNKQFVKKFMKN